MYVTLKAYLERLDASERSKPAVQRRAVPTIGELAAELQIHRVTLSNIANGKIQQLDLRTGGRIITALRRHGFDTQVGDIIAYRPPEEVQQS
jgi:DNA-binding Xre family transcriptional regulator